MWLLTKKSEDREDPGSQYCVTSRTFEVNIHNKHNNNQKTGVSTYISFHWLKDIKERKKNTYFT